MKMRGTCWIMMMWRRSQIKREEPYDSLTTPTASSSNHITVLELLGDSYVVSNASVPYVFMLFQIFLYEMLHAPQNLIRCLACYFSIYI
ncbi:hypothetical protein PO909_028839, partial [Leuciscus waleckii]